MTVLWVPGHGVASSFEAKRVAAHPFAPSPSSTRTRTSLHRCPALPLTSGRHHHQRPLNGSRGSGFHLAYGRAPTLIPVPLMLHPTSNTGKERTRSREHARLLADTKQQAAAAKQATLFTSLLFVFIQPQYQSLRRPPKTPLPSNPSRTLTFYPPAASKCPLLPPSSTTTLHSLHLIKGTARNMAQTTLASLPQMPKKASGAGAALRALD